MDGSVPERVHERSPAQSLFSSSFPGRRLPDNGLTSPMPCKCRPCSSASTLNQAVQLFCHHTARRDAVRNKAAGDAVKLNGDDCRDHSSQTPRHAPPQVPKSQVTRKPHAAPRTWARIYRKIMLGRKKLGSPCCSLGGDDNAQSRCKTLADR
jgi:hypothetical protein